MTFLNLFFGRNDGVKVGDGVISARFCGGVLLFPLG